MKSKFSITALILSAINVFGQAENEYYKFSSDLESDLKKDTTAWKYQMGATNFSVSGYYKTALEVWNKRGAGQPKISAKDSLLFSTLKSASAKDYIINRSSKEEIIIINEAHHNSKHRAFTMSLLKGLYTNGYKYLGLEALFDTEINTRKYPLLESGFYTKEPEFGNLISEALKIGFTLFGYEVSDGKNGKEREIEQARNIKKFIDQHSNGKVLIHCGYAHVYENDYKPWEKAMAGRLKDYSGIDPFTVDQETFTEKGNPELNHPFVNLITDENPVVLISREGEVFNGLSEPKQTDIVVVHPITRYTKGRPDWLASGKISYRLPEEKLKKLPILVLAYRNGEYGKNGVPADIIEITEQNKEQCLYLSPNLYEIVLKNRDYKLIETYKMRIE